MMNRIQKHGFALIELIISIVVLGIVLIPLGLMSMEYMREIVYSRDLAAAEGLAKTEMSIVNNIPYSDATLADGYDNTTSNYAEHPYDLCRTVSFANSPTNTLKKVQVRVYPSGSTTQLANVITYLASVSFGTGSGGGSTSSGGQSDFLVVSAGVVSANRLHQIDMQNTDPANSITISQVIISWTNSKDSQPASLTQIEMGGSTRWSGTESTSGSTVTLTSPFTLSANTTYTNTGIFTFSQGIKSVTIIFVMSDSSTTASMIW